jgi:hypothetical protein
MCSLKEVKEVPNTLNRLRESQMMGSIFPKYAVVVFVIGLYFVAGSVLLSYYVTAAVVRCAQVLYTENRQHDSTTCLDENRIFQGALS